MGFSDSATCVSEAGLCGRDLAGKTLALRGTAQDALSRSGRRVHALLVDSEGGVAMRYLDGLGLVVHRWARRLRSESTTTRRRGEHDPVATSGHDRLRQRRRRNVADRAAPTPAAGRPTSRRETPPAPIVRGLTISRHRRLPGGEGPRRRRRQARRRAKRNAPVVAKRPGMFRVYVTPDASWTPRARHRRAAPRRRHDEVPGHPRRRRRSPPRRRKRTPTRRSTSRSRPRASRRRDVPVSLTAQGRRRRRDGAEPRPLPARRNSQDLGAETSGKSRSSSSR